MADQDRREFPNKQEQNPKSGEGVSKNREHMAEIDQKGQSDQESDIGSGSDIDSEIDSEKEEGGPDNVLGEQNRNQGTGKVDKKTG
jgi:hypothetical protein